MGEITLLSGRSTSGKLTLAYKLLASAQRTSAGGVAHTVALLDLSCTADPDYVARCGVDLDYLLVGRPPTGRKAVELLGDLIQRHGLHALVVDSLADLTAEPATMRYLNTLLPRLRQAARMSGCVLVVLDEPCAPGCAGSTWTPAARCVGRRRCTSRCSASSGCARAAN